MHVDDQEPQQSLLPKFEFENVSEDVSGSRRTSQRISSANGQEPQTVIEGSDTAKETVHWSSEQAFFAVMGGFAIENDYIDENNTKVTIRQLVTVGGVLQLTKLGLIPAMDPEDIEERSKADIIAKMFVLSQITWFGLQVIGVECRV